MQFPHYDLRAGHCLVDGVGTDAIFMQCRINHPNVLSANTNRSCAHHVDCVNNGARVSIGSVFLKILGLKNSATDIWKWDNTITKTCKSLQRQVNMAKDLLSYSLKLHYEFLVHCMAIALMIGSNNQLCNQLCILSCMFFLVFVNDATMGTQ